VTTRSKASRTGGWQLPNFRVRQVYLRLPGGALARTKLLRDDKGLVLHPSEGERWNGLGRSSQFCCSGAGSLIGAQRLTPQCDKGLKPRSIGRELVGKRMGSAGGLGPPNKAHADFKAMRPGRDRSNI
jgi:hypothetical protein